MAQSAKKIILVGWDGAPPQMIERMVKKGLLKNFAGLMERGTFIRALNPYPTITASAPPRPPRTASLERHQPALSPQTCPLGRTRRRHRGYVNSPAGQR